MPTKTWNGSSADWYTPGDWSPAGDPGPTDDVVINGGEAELLSGDAAIKVKSIILHRRDSRNSGYWENPIGQRKRFDHRAAARCSSTGPETFGGAGGSQPDDRREADQQQHRGYGLDIGNTGITSADTVTVNGAGGLSNGGSGYINIEGSATAQATLNIANAAAGFGTKGVETGTVVLENDALLEFKSGQITTVNGELQLNGASAHVADAGTTGSNSALTGLTSVSEHFLSGERRKGRDDRQFEHHRQRARFSSTGPTPAAPGAAA